MPASLTQTNASHILITTDAVGGVWTYSLALAACFAEVGIQTTLAVLGPPPSAVQRAVANSIWSCSVIPTGLPLDWQVVSASGLRTITCRLQELVLDGAYTSVHLHSPALAAQAWPIHAVVVVHSCMATWWDEVERTPKPAEVSLHAGFCKAGLLLADSVIAPSQSFADAIKKTYALSRDISVVYNAVTDQKRRGVHRECFVLSAGRLWDRAKNLNILETAAQMTDVPIVVAGPVFSPGQAAVACKNVIHVGDLSREALADMMARATAFVAPSIYEPFGLAVLEAAQLATPLILADIPTFRELWHNAAIFVPVDDAAAWAAAISLLVGDSGLAQRLGAAANARAQLYRLSCMGAATIDHHGSSRLADNLAANASPSTCA